MKWRDYIEENPKILGGKPVFKGTRLSVAFILEALGAGEAPEHLLEQLPTLKRERFQAAYAFAADQIGLTRSALIDRDAVLSCLLPPLRLHTARKCRNDFARAGNFFSISRS